MHLFLLGKVKPLISQEIIWFLISSIGNGVDLSVKKGGLPKVFKNTNVKFCFFSFTSDWLFPTSETKTIIKSLNISNSMVSFVEIKTDKGHDAFLLDEPEFHSTLKWFIEGQMSNLGIWKKF